MEKSHNDLEKIKDSFEMRAILFYFDTNNGDYKKAKSMLDELSKVRSDDKRIFELQGLYHLTQGEHEEGEVDLAEIDPKEFVLGLNWNSSNKEW